MAMFQDAWMETLLSKNDIVSVVSPLVQLRPKGGRLWGLCPFHSEKTPSFSVVPDKQFYYCFGCHRGGGVVQFVMETERLSYVEAVRQLAQRVGMELPGEVDDAALQRERALKERLYAACRKAALYYHAQLREERGAAAREYLSRRGLTADIVTRFGIGYAPESWDALALHLHEEGFSQEELILGGLLVRNPQSGRVYDAYRNRVVFPIIGVNGRVLGFGARAMGEEKPKYINTGDTPIYNKRNNLYALNLQKGARAQELVMVEGYMDVISLHQAGVCNAVASLGTALTQQQARLLKRYVPTVYIAYDGDAAGQNATLRGLDILAREGLAVRVVVMPNGLDPDDFVRQNGKEAFDALRDNALSLHAFKLERMELEYDLAGEDGREEYAKAACAFIATLQPVEQERYYLMVSRKTGMSQQTLQAQGMMRPVRHEQNRANRVLDRFVNGDTRRPAAERERTELLLIKAALAQEEAAKLALEAAAFSLEDYTAFVQAVLDAFTKTGKPPEAALLLSAMEPEQTKRLSGILQDDGTPLQDPMATAHDCIRKLRVLDIEEEITALKLQATSDALALEEKLAHAQRIQELDAMRRELRLQ